MKTKTRTQRAVRAIANEPSYLRVLVANRLGAVRETKLDFLHDA